MRSSSNAIVPDLNRCSSVSPSLLTTGQKGLRGVSIKVFNSLTRQKEEFRPRDEGKVGIYVCGVTPYSNTHIGHARPAVVWDVIRRYLEHRGYQVFMVQNYTDVDDKIINRAQELGVDPLDLAEELMARFEDEMEKLRVRPPDAAPRATQHIEDMIEVIETLITKGHAYQVNGDVYFDISSYRGYGKLSNRRTEELVADESSDYRALKRNPGDFALWKSAKPGEPSWDSPWGKGRPGWHIECTAMSVKHLGPGFDFHGGGTDLVFPHHENEIAQSEAYLEGPLVRYWLHHGMLRLQGEKMSKSLGNVVELGNILENFPGQAVRYYLLSAHYRKPLNFSWALLENAERAWRRWVNGVQGLEALPALNHVQDPPARDDSLAKVARQCLAEFEGAMDDDFNTPQAMAKGFDLIRRVNEAVSSGTATEAGLEEARRVLEIMGDILGLNPDLGSPDRSSITGDLLDLLVAIRSEMRARKDWVWADKIRDHLAGLGVTLEDTPKGTRWKWGEGGEA